MKRLKHEQPAGACGFALIEVLVSLLIFMFGVLGTVGLLSSTTRIETESKFRTDAADLANDAISMLWTTALTDLAAYDGAACSQQIRCKEWQNRISTLLPQGSGALSVTGTTGDVTVTIQWTLPGRQTHRYVTATTVAKKEGS
jgi:type IV pilus assembly protein PilV